MFSLSSQEYQTMGEAQAAIDMLDGKDVDGRELRVNEAQDKPER
jgi:RNA recognition motif-containing protein